MIEVEAAQEILVGFAVAAMLGNDKPRHDLERLRGPRENALVDLLARDAKRTRRIVHVGRRPGPRARRRGRPSVRRRKRR